MYEEENMEIVLSLRIVASGQQCNQGGVPRDGGGWFNLAPFSSSPVCHE